MVEKELQNKILISFLIFLGFIAGLMVAFWIMSNGSEILETEEEVDFETGEETIKTALDTSYIQVEDQIAGDYVLVDKTFFSEPGWLVAYDGPVGEARHILGAQFLPRGEHSGIVIWLQRGTIAGELYRVAIHTDDGYIKETEYGRHHFDYRNDPPLQDKQGNFIFDNFRTESLGSRG